MIETLIIGLVALIVSVLTFFSGFGLGTLLMPAFAAFFPLPVAIAATAVVHLVNNLFKGALLWRQADWGVTLRFTVPAAIMAVLGALALNAFTGLPAIVAYDLANHHFEIIPVKLVMSLLIALFAVLELAPGFKHWTLPPRFIPLGGALSGFFGGLSGHQGALRTVFLIRAGLDKQAYVATVVLSAVVVDCFRLATYGVTLFPNHFQTLAAQDKLSPIMAGCVFALIGSLLGKRLLKSVSLESIQKLVGVLLLLFGLALAVGVI
jgi:hypothetical protein